MAVGMLEFTQSPTAIRKADDHEAGGPNWVFSQSNSPMRRLISPPPLPKGDFRFVADFKLRIFRIEL
jgi:hypothetical protein